MIEELEKLVALRKVNRKIMYKFSIDRFRRGLNFNTIKKVVEEYYKHTSIDKINSEDYNINVGETYYEIEITQLRIDASKSTLNSLEKIMYDDHCNITEELKRLSKINKDLELLK